MKRLCFGVVALLILFTLGNGFVVWFSLLIELICVGTQLLNTTRSVKQYVQNEFRRLEEEIIIPNKKLFPSSITLDDFFWAFGILRSRAFSRLRNENLVVIPFADFVRTFSFSLCMVTIVYTKAVRLDYRNTSRTKNRD